MTTTPEEKDYIAEVIAEDNAKRSPKPLRRADDCAVPPAGDVEVLLDGVLDEMSRRFDLSKRDDDHMVYDDTQIGVEFAIEALRPALTRLTAERDGLLAEVAELKQQVEWRGEMAASNGREYIKQLVIANTLKFELTKAREAMLDVISNLGEFCCVLDSQEQVYYITSQLDKLAHNVDESCGQDAEAAKVRCCERFPKCLHGEGADGL